MKSLWEGLFKRNPVFVLLLGLVPAVAVTSTAYNGWVLGLVTAIVLVVSSMLNYLLTPMVPQNARVVLRMAILIVLVVFSHSVLLTRNPQIVAQLGIFLPLIVANSLVLQTCEQEKSLGTVTLRALGQGLGFLLALVLIGVIREFLGFGTILGTQVVRGSLPPLALASSVPGGLIILGLLLALVNKFTGQGGELHD
jgi:electron transport complex protein RnfE